MYDWTREDFETFAAELGPYGWAWRVDEHGDRWIIGGLTHAASGAATTVHKRGDRLETYDGSRSSGFATTKIREHADGTSANPRGKAADWAATARVWALRVGARQIDAHATWEAKRAKDDLARGAAHRSGASLRDHLAPVDPLALLRTGGSGMYVTLRVSTGYSVGGAYASADLSISPTDTGGASVYVDGATGTALLPLSEILRSVAEWQAGYTDSAGKEG